MIHRSPYVVVAAMQFDVHLANMIALSRHTQFQVLREQPAAQAPQANMLHMRLPDSRERALEVRAGTTSCRATSYFKLYVDDHFLEAMEKGGKPCWRTQNMARTWPEWWHLMLSGPTIS